MAMNPQGQEAADTRSRRVLYPVFCYGKLEDGFVPVQDSDAGYRHAQDRRVGVRREVAEAAHKQYARHHAQTFDRLHERGGFSVGELLALLTEATWQPHP